MRDPRRMMCAAILALQSIAVGLSTPVLIMVEDIDRSLALWIGLGLAAVALVLAGLLRHEWAYAAGFAVQVATIALGVLIPVMFVLGLAFGALWTTAYLLGRKIEADRAAWSAQHGDDERG